MSSSWKKVFECGKFLVITVCQNNVIRKKNRNGISEEMSWVCQKNNQATQRKRSFAVPEINIFKHIVSTRGTQPDNRKVKAVANALAPKTSAEVHWFLSFVNHCSRFVEDYTYPLRQLLKEKTKFLWGKEQPKCLLKLKQAITSTPIPAHFSISAPARVVADSSPSAVGAVLLQQQSDSTYRLRKSFSHRNRNEILPNRKGSISHCLRVRTLSSSPVRQIIGNGNRSSLT